MSYARKAKFRNKSKQSMHALDVNGLAISTTSKQTSNSGMDFGNDSIVSEVAYKPSKDAASMRIISNQGGKLKEFRQELEFQPLDDPIMKNTLAKPSAPKRNNKRTKAKAIQKLDTDSDSD